MTTPGIGSNTGVAPDAPATSFSHDQLRTILERIENREAAKQEISDDVKEIYQEAKSNGFDCKALREIVRLRKQDPNKVAEAETILDVYKHALGMLV